MNIASTWIITLFLEISKFLVLDWQEKRTTQLRMDRTSAFDQTSVISTVFPKRLHRRCTGPPVPDQTSSDDWKSGPVRQERHPSPLSWLLLSCSLLPSFTPSLSLTISLPPPTPPPPVTCLHLSCNKHLINTNKHYSSNHIHFGIINMFH